MLQQPEVRLCPEYWNDVREVFVYEVLLSICEGNEHVISRSDKMLENYGCPITCALKMGAGTEKVMVGSVYGHKILMVEGVYF